MQSGLKKYTIFFTLLFCLVSMSFMVAYAANKVITVTDVAQDQMTFEQGGDGANGGSEGNVLQLAPESVGDVLCIPIRQSAKAEDITLENHYMERELWIYIKGPDDSFYEDKVISGHLDDIDSGVWEYRDGVSLLKFKLNGIYECRNVLKDNLLYIAFDKPRDVFEKIVVIDPGNGGSDDGYKAHGLKEKELNLDIARRLKEKLDGTDIKVYYTRMDDTEPGAEERIGIANDVKADLFISIRMNGNEEDASLYGTETMYSPEFFIPGFDGTKLADLVEREVVTSISGRGLGLVPAGSEDTEVWKAVMPAVTLKAGYITNKQEAELLSRESYRERIAEGLYNAILKAFEQMK